MSSLTKCPKCENRKIRKEKESCLNADILNRHLNQLFFGSIDRSLFSLGGRFDSKKISFKRSWKVNLT